MKLSVDEIARRVAGTVAGDGAKVIAGARPLDMAGPNDVAFLESEKRADELAKSQAGAVLVPAAVAAEGRTLICVGDPLMAFVALYRDFNGLTEPASSGVDPRAAVHPSAVIGEGATILPFAYVGEGVVIGARAHVGSGASIGRNCRLGDDVMIHANAVLYERTTVGHRAIIHSGAVIGADGYGYRLRAGRHVKVPQLGTVEIGDDVEIGANTAVDRSTFDVTRIGAGSKIDNLVQIGHNCQVGRHNLLVGQSGMGGSVKTGDYVALAGQAGIADHMQIGARVVIGAQAGVGQHIPEGQRVLGTPAIAWRDHMYQIWANGRLAEWAKDIKAIKARLGMDKPGL